MGQGMREISKAAEPRLLQEYRLGGGEYDGPDFTHVKDTIRASLLAEQGHLCAYCMVRITASNMKVEHWACQSDYPLLQLDYSNLLGCCMGYEGERFVSQTCDSRKGNHALKFNPSRPQDRVNALIKYDGLGKIDSTDEEFAGQINGVLNLNKERLVQNRSYILTSLRVSLSCKNGKRTKAEIQRLLDEYRIPNAQGKLREYCGLVEAYLSTKL
ncbi:retron system putative HNH endonuclease [Sodalis sp. RH15]|uniref:retron system putative HNH endonuclease n=1 Tax=Sodalis sp. RH15 TaxID=3394330 RepID=UPI0039B3C880